MPSNVDWNALNHTEGDVPWDAVQGAIAALAEKPEDLQDWIFAYQETCDDEDYRGFLPLYIPVILAEAASRITPDHPAWSKIASFLLDVMEEARDNGSDMTLTEFHYACGRLGPAILPEVLRRIDSDPDSEEPDLEMWGLLCLSARTSDGALRETVARLCVERIERILRGESDVFHAWQPMLALTDLHRTDLLPLLEELKSRKEKELKDAYLMPDCDACIESLRAASPVQRDEWWDRDPKDLLTGQLMHWKEWYADLEDGEDEDPGHYEDDEAAAPEGIVSKTEKEWSAAFAASPQAAALPPELRSHAEDRAKAILHFGFTRLDIDVRSWGRDGWEEVLTELLPEKVTAEPEWFHGLNLVAAALVRWLEAEKHLTAANTLATTVEGWGERIENAAADPDNWGIAKTLMRQAVAEGVEPGNQEQLAAFIARYNAKIERENRAREEEEGYEDYESDKYEEPFFRTEPKIGRNDPCPCRSGKKYKKCCGR